MIFNIINKNTHAELRISASEKETNFQEIQNEILKYPAFILIFDEQNKNFNVESALKIINELLKISDASNRIMVVLKPDKLNKKELEKINIDWAPTLSEATDLIFMLLIEKEL